MSRGLRIGVLKIFLKSEAGLIEKIELGLKKEIKLGSKKEIKLSIIVGN